MALWRNIILSVVVAFVAVGVCSAQQGEYVRYARYLGEGDRINRAVEMGVSVGASYMGLSSTADAVTLSPRIGVRAALEMSLMWEQRYALQMEVAYLSNKADVALGNRELTLRSNVVEVPLMFSYRGWKPLRIGAGVVLSPMASGHYDTEFERLEFGQVRQMVGYVADVGVNLTRHLLIDARFTGSFGKSGNYFEGVEFSTQGWWLSFGLGYMF